MTETAIDHEAVRKLAMRLSEVLGGIPVATTVPALVNCLSISVVTATAEDDIDLVFAVIDEICRNMRDQVSKLRLLMLERPGEAGAAH